MEKKNTSADVKRMLDAYNESNLTFSAVSEPPSELLWEATFKHNTPRLIFLAPPQDTCSICSTHLATHNAPTTIICYTESGPIPGLKITLRCPNCGINYRYDQYGNENMGGYRYYHGYLPYIQASQLCYVSRKCYNEWCAYRYVIAIYKNLLHYCLPCACMHAVIMHGSVLRLLQRCIMK